MKVSVEDILMSRYRAAGGPGLTRDAASRDDIKTATTCWRCQKLIAERKLARSNMKRMTRSGRPAEILVALEHYSEHLAICAHFRKPPFNFDEVIP